MQTLTAFELYLHRSDRKPVTIRVMLVAIKRILAICQPLNRTTFDTYLYELHSQGRNNNYLNRLVNYARIYAIFIGDTELAKTPFFRKQQVLKSCLTDEEIEAILSAPRRWRQDIAVWHRWTNFFAVCAYTGCRMSEVAKLRKENVIWGNNVLEILDGKTGSRLVPIAPALAPYLRYALRYAKGSLLFPSSENKSYTDTKWCEEFHRRCKQMGIARRHGLTPYSLRHSLITRLLDTETINLFTVQQIVGHKKTDTTAQYYHCSTKKMQTAIRQDPLNRLVTPPQEILQTVVASIKQLNLFQDNRLLVSLQETGSSISLSVAIKNDG